MKERRNRDDKKSKNIGGKRERRTKEEGEEGGRWEEIRKGSLDMILFIYKIQDYAPF